MRWRIFIALADFEYAGHQMTFQFGMPARCKNAKTISG
jgi:hypothetical protein